MSSQDRGSPLSNTPEGGRAGYGAGASGWDDSADQFAGGMAYVPCPGSPEGRHDDARAAGRKAEPPPHSPAGDPVAVPHDPLHPRPSPARRRRRSRRHRARRQLSPILVVAGVVAVIGAIIGVGGGFGMVWLMRESPLASVESPEEQEERAAFIAACAQTLTSIDCGCLWEDARPAFTPEYRAAVLRLIDERRMLPVRLQRIRSEKLLGPELAKTVWEAAYYCTKR